MPATKPATSKNATFRLACFTIFDMEFKWSRLQAHLQYYAYGKEKCPTTGKEHYQCFGYSSKAQRMSWWIRLVEPSHVERCLGTLEDNEKYCSKSGDYTEWGLKPMGNGLKRGMLVIKEAIESGESLRKIQRRDECFEDCIRYRRALKEFEQDVRVDNMYAAGFKKRMIHVYIGQTGSGKSRDVREQFPFVYFMPDNKLQWAGSYDGQSAVVFDDVGPGNIMSVTDFLRYTDGYPIEAPVKGGFTAWLPEHIFFTSNCPVSQWWKDISPLHLEAVERRIDQIRVYKGPGDYESYASVH